jgi:hypothetical protein
MSEPAPRYTIEESGLKPDLLNANEGTQRGRGLLEKSLRKLGAGRSILTDKDGNVIAGNKTLEGAAEIGLPVRIIETDGTELVVVKRTDLDLYDGKDKRARQLAYADNKIAELDLSWKPEQIEADFAPLDLGEWGFSLITLDESEAFGALPDEDRAPFQQMTFTLHDTQAEQVREAIKIAKAQGAFTDSENENSNGNALARICETFITDYGNG